mgnify:CR=1 FL=1
MREQIVKVLEGNLAAGVTADLVALELGQLMNATAKVEYSDKLLEAFKSECGLKSDSTAEKYLRAALAVI